MAIRKTILKNTHLDAVVKIVNDQATNDTVTIDLDVDLLKSNESLSGKPLDVAIRNVEWSLQSGTGLATITRNSKVIQRLHNSHSFEQGITSDHEESSSDIVVNMTGGTIIMHLLKTSGYLGNYQSEPRL